MQRAAAVTDAAAATATPSPLLWRLAIDQPVGFDSRNGRRRRCCRGGGWWLGAVFTPAAAAVDSLGALVGGAHAGSPVGACVGAVDATAAAAAPTPVECPDGAAPIFVRDSGGGSGGADSHSDNDGDLATAPSTPFIPA